jgi:hypothetical protein
MGGGLAAGLFCGWNGRQGSQKLSIEKLFHRRITEQPVNYIELY